MSEETILQVKNLRVDFHTYAGEIKAIRDVNFDLKKGETLAIVGESGSGKSVTTKTLMGLSAPNANITGDIDFMGKKLLDLKEDEWTKVRGNEIAMIFQDPMTSLDPTMRIGQQIAEPIMIHEKVSKQEALKRALELMKSVGIPKAEEHINDYPHQWSGGMRQRAVIAIALAANPDVLIADEPTTALDVTIQAQILSLMKKIQKERNSSIVFITHDLGVVAGMADRVAVMYAGKIVETAKVNDIFKNAAHPYTKALLSSLPSHDTSKEDKLTSIPGTPPDLIKPPVGCGFASRCEKCMKICKAKQPPVFDLGDGHSASCWLLHKDCPQGGNK